ncbi:tRNA dimethylallyltransferase [Exophiala spinifera]|uniref:tRNA dimethylallyltransferase n=1 Tax=Exophiala spinifera TaxID=91928 RepID=A0A0D2A745_9EURO|nr:tRNA dimethylallyltransferase [Exophiala spinifera]KIW20582.1 tRNA dimethylallyltransferase [Exophiala spinifera]
MSLIVRRALNMVSHRPDNPVVVVIGATGTGKSKLAVDLATRFNGEIINGDAMQMYKGLPIITNKIPQEERNGIRHHLLDFIGLEEPPWTVHKFVKESTKVVDEIRSRGKLPILVGGTHYYTHALLFKDETLSADEEEGGTEDAEAKGSEDLAILSRSTEEIFAKLQEVDPQMAVRWHPRDRRKIQRSLEIWLKTGRKASEVYAAQQERKGAIGRNSGSGSMSGDLKSMIDSGQVSALRYPTLLLWLEAEDAVLKERLNARVDSMVESGLVDEAAALASLENGMVKRGSPVDKTMGIWVSIGYKELGPYIQEQQASGADSPQSSRALAQAVEAVKAGTRRYAKRQNRYIRIRLANALQQAGEFNMLFLLDGTDLENWDTKVFEQAQALVKSFLDGEALPEHKSLSELADSILSASNEGGVTDSRVARKCETCDKILMTTDQWNRHLSSRGHKKAAVAQRKREATSNQVPNQTCDVFDSKPT